MCKKSKFYICRTIQYIRLIKKKTTFRYKYIKNTKYCNIDNGDRKERVRQYAEKIFEFIN